MAKEPTKTEEDWGEGVESDWKHEAWRAWLRGDRNYAALGRKFEKDWKTVKRAIIAKGKDARMVIESGDCDALAEYIDGLYDELQEVNTLFQDADNDNARLGALKHRTYLREKIAAALGVPTELAALQLSGKGGDPIEHSIAFHGTPEQLAKFAARAIVRRREASDERSDSV